METDPVNNSELQTAVFQEETEIQNIQSQHMDIQQLDEEARPAPAQQTTVRPIRDISKQPGRAKNRPPRGFRRWGKGYGAAPPQNAPTGF